MSLHQWLGRHVVDHKISHWERGHFVSSCTICGKAMKKLPGMGWQLDSTGA